MDQTKKNKSVMGIKYAFKQKQKGKGQEDAYLDSIKKHFHKNKINSQIIIIINLKKN